MTARRYRYWILLLGLLIALLLAGVIFWALGNTDVAGWLWAGATVAGLIVATFSTLRAVLQRRLSVDIIAILALAGSLVVDEPLAGAVVALMLATGQLLEARAQARANSELSALVERAPQRARILQGDEVVDVPVGEVQQGQTLIVGTGQIVPVDGQLLSPGTFDESALTGESALVERAAGRVVRSGIVNAGSPVELTATTTAADSSYAQIVRLVEAAQASSAPFVRAADRIAIIFVPLTLLLAGSAWWLSQDPVRAVAVFVVATPCPLILAVPIAIMSAMAQCSRIGVVVKGGAALERLAAARTMLFDKTGTLTVGRPTVVDVVVAADLSAEARDRVVSMAASLDQVSSHILAGAVVAHAREQGAVLRLPDSVEEVPGYGLTGRVGDETVRVGKLNWVIGDEAIPDWARRARRRAALDGSSTVFVSINGSPAGAFLLEDPLRPDAATMVRQLRGSGITRIVLVSGDKAPVANAVATMVDADGVFADQDPEQKVDVVRREGGSAVTVMVGDGINDAPALAIADVGVAVATLGASAASESADVVLTADRVSALAAAIRIARRSRRIALQSAWTGMSLSAVAMLAAAFGLLPPVAGALLQEAIDVLAIGLALRAVRPGRASRMRITAAEAATAEQLLAEHTAIRAIVELVRITAERLSSDPTSLEEVRSLSRRLNEQLLPHEQAEEHTLYPIVARLMGGPDSMGAMSRGHSEIIHQAGRIQRLTAEIGSGEPSAEDVVELQRLLFGLYAILRLHNAQEEEGAYALLAAAAPRTAPGERASDSADH